MAQDNERDRLKQSARESALLLLKVVAGVVAVSVIVGEGGLVDNKRQRPALQTLSEPRSGHALRGLRAGMAVYSGR
ncbi:TPA: hypothetical protein ACGHH5_003832 [Salmonella enterica subsp. enterica serovar 1,4,[5],12:b:-]|uniref:hypothetical protein n=1 Tax=Salmonella sp. SAL00672 TaxID=3159749 RepID=UPI0035E7BFF6|nr:hypothetical protein [Salmonella enterica]